MRVRTTVLTSVVVTVALKDARRVDKLMAVPKVVRTAASTAERAVLWGELTVELWGLTSAEKMVALEVELVLGCYPKVSLIGALVVKYKQVTFLYTNLDLVISNK